MADRPSSSPFPSVDRLARRSDIDPLIKIHGRTALIEAIRHVVEAHRSNLSEGTKPPGEDQLAREVGDRLSERQLPSLKPLFNLTGTVLHTNLGRALLPQSAIDRASQAMGGASNLEYDLDLGKRGERDTHVAGLLEELTGAEAATIVNNNAAAVLLALAALAPRREVVVSRGELIEIGGAFRIPDIMRSANAKLVEVGTTNRTHVHDYEGAIGSRTAALMKVHASNYEIRGFVADVDHDKLAGIAHKHSLPLIVDLGAGSLVDISVYGLPREPIVSEVIAAGADIVTFSGDKLLGGPQSGVIVGRKDLIARINRHPLKRALRVSKMTIAALEAVLLEYRKPDQLRDNLPTLRLLSRPADDIRAVADRLQPIVAGALGADWNVSIAKVSSQVGSGSLPVDVLPSFALEITPTARKGIGTALAGLAAKLRDLPRPVIGRIAGDALFLDLRCLEDEHSFVGQIGCLANSRNGDAG